MRLMTATVLDRTALHDYLPHRGLNILLDELQLDQDAGLAISHFSVPSDDPHGRCLFAAHHGDRGTFWLEPFLGEAVALTGVPLLMDEVAAVGKVSVFSMISRVDFLDLAPMAADIEASAQIKRRRGNFTQFACKVRHDGRTIMNAEVLSGAASLDDVASIPARPLQQAVGETVSAPGFKHPSLHFIRGVRQFDADERRLTATYIYPENHPLVPGHFPGGAVMMGVTQWMAVADAAWLLRERLGMDQAITVDGRIVRDDGSEVLDVRELTVAPSPTGLPMIRCAKRCAFRDMVIPGDGIVIEVTAR
jgi:3-hydroxymyristoyl/3-hydroxydecanoyl-(acyl carrier protein) dehydratase